MFLSAWYQEPVLDRVHERSSIAEFDEKLERIVAFEKASADDRALILKFWMHLGKDAQKRRLKSLEKHPLKSWRVTEKDWENWRKYDDFEAQLVEFGVVLLKYWLHITPRGTAGALPGP